MDAINTVYPLIISNGCGDYEDNEDDNISNSKFKLSDS